MNFAPQIDLSKPDELANTFCAIDDQNRYVPMQRWQKSVIQEDPNLGIPICRICGVPAKRMTKWLDTLTDEYAFVHPNNKDMPNKKCEDKFFADKEGPDEIIVPQWPFRAQVVELTRINRIDKQKSEHLSIHPYRNIRPTKAHRIICISVALLNALKTIGVPVQELGEPK
ncbi:hypothetical protein KJ652_00685 [Patescibacteria group bacterium]|nr:hypothetical protein [Patescibacteria group bacterium]